jgi:hypothetical protein
MTADKTVSFWDDEDFEGDDKIRFDSEGDIFTGKVMTLSKERSMSGDMVPRLVLETSDGRAMILIAGATDLKRKLVAAAPQIGDDVTIELEDIKPLGGGRAFKTYSVHVDRTS